MAKKKEILYDLLLSMSHPSAEELFLACKEKNIKMSIATIYRNLGILQEEGRIQKISISGEPDRYDTNLTCHIHAVCDRCHSIEDYEIEGFTDFLTEKTNLQIHSYDLVIRHICASCRKKEALNIYSWVGSF